MTRLAELSEYGGGSSVELSSAASSACFCKHSQSVRKGPSSAGVSCCVKSPSVACLLYSTYDAIDEYVKEITTVDHL